MRTSLWHLWRRWIQGHCAVITWHVQIIKKKTKKTKSIENIASWGPVSSSLKNLDERPGSCSSEPVKKWIYGAQKIARFELIIYLCKFGNGGRGISTIKFFNLQLISSFYLPKTTYKKPTNRPWIIKVNITCRSRVVIFFVYIYT